MQALFLTKAIVQFLKSAPKQRHFISVLSAIKALLPLEHPHIIHVNRVTSDRRLALFLDFLFVLGVALPGDEVQSSCEERRAKRAELEMGGGESGGDQNSSSSEASLWASSSQLLTSWVLPGFVAL